MFWIFKHWIEFNWFFFNSVSATKEQFFILTTGYIHIYSVYRLNFIYLGIKASLNASERNTSVNINNWSESN